MPSLPSLSWHNSLYTANAPEHPLQPMVRPVWIDRDFTPHHEAAIERALAEWNTVLNGHLVYQVRDAHLEVDSLAIITELVNDDGLLFVQKRVDDVDVSTGILGWVEDLGSPVVYLVEGAGEADDGFRIVAEHEVGHVLGMPHENHLPGTLMYPYFNWQPSCIDEVAVRILADIHDWNVDHLNWCTNP